MRPERINIPDSPSEKVMQAILNGIPPVEIQFQPCPHASSSGEHELGKWSLGDCELIDLGHVHLVLCPQCWQIVKAAVYEDMIARYARVRRDARRGH